MIRKAYVDTSQGQIHYRVKEGEGTPIVCFHQTASSSAMFERLMIAYPGPEPLYALDTPGFGGSFDPEGLPSMADYSAMLVEAIKALGIESSHLFGHHTGASAAVEIAVRDPDLAASLSMIGPVTITREEAEAFKSVYPKPFEPVPDGGHLQVMWDYVGDILKAPSRLDSLALHHREFVDTARAWEGHIKVYKVIWDQGFSGLYAQVRCPLLIMCSPDDVLWPVFSRAKELRPDAKAVELAGSNFQTDEVPEQVSGVLSDFLKGLA